jgi:hypothetical protein
LPARETWPISGEIVTEAASRASHVNAENCPRVMVSPLARKAMAGVGQSAGAAAAAAGGWGGGGVFPPAPAVGGLRWHAPRINMPASKTAIPADPERRPCLNFISDSSLRVMMRRPFIGAPR